ncbi:hypothetical protein [Burkholderia sp. MSMB1826]|uniref:hypothetical protein n=1 Tax=Burkholderia sp. MSMB1826 TaxID=1637875 RepID=UPI0012E397BC|nr:hypothetical protein [Burkholderia sp. MSMB1826]
MNAPLASLEPKLRAGAPGTIAGPGYVYTSMAPLQLRQNMESAHTINRPASVTEFSARNSSWLKARAESLTRKLHESARPGLGALQPDAVRAIDSERAFASVVEALFTHNVASSSADIHMLIGLLAGTASEHPADSAHIRLAGALQCARALSAATNGNARQAVAALDHLRRRFSLDVVSEETTSGDAQRHAWHAARLLSRTSTGFDALVALRDDPALHEYTDDGAMKRESLRTFLQAATHLMESRPEDQPHPDSPSAQIRDAIAQLASAQDPSTLPDALALNALLCAAKVYAAPYATAKQIADSNQIAGYVAWRSGYRMSGSGSPLARTQRRIAKFMIWIRRAERRATHRGAAFDPRRFVGMQKSPLTATGYGTGGANLGLVNREAEARHEALHGVLDAVISHLGVLLQNPALPVEQRHVLLFRQQCIVRWRAVSKRSFQSDELKLSRRDQEIIAATVMTLAPRAGLDGHAVRRYRAVADVKKLDLKTLERWLHEAALLAATPEDGTEPHPHVERMRELNRARRLRSAGATRAAFRAALTHVIDTTPLGNNVRYFDGGTYGLNFNSSVNLEDFKAMFGVSVGPGVKVLRGRHAFLEIGSSSYGGEIFMGTDARSSRGVSFGVFGGVALGNKNVHATLGGGVGMAYSRDRSAPRGVIIRTQLKRDADDKVTESWREQANSLVGFLFEQSALTEASGPTTPECLWERFSARFFRMHDISVNWRDQRRSSHTISTAASAMARIGVAGWHVGPAFSASYDSLLAGKNERVDANGWLRGTERSRSRSAALTVNATLVAASSSMGNFSTHPGHPQSVSLPSVPVVGLTTALIPSGASVTLRMVDEHGRAHPRYIRRLVEFLDPQSFLSYLNTRREGIAHGAASKATLNAFIDEVRASSTRGNQAFGESAKIRPEIAETVSAYRDEIDMIKQCARSGISSDERDNVQIALLEAEITRLLNSPESWKISGYYTYELGTRGYAAGLATLAQATASTSANGERVLAELAMSKLQALDELEIATRDETPGAQ